MTEEAWKPVVRKRNAEILRFTVGLASLTTFITSAGLLLSWWVVVGGSAARGMLALGVGAGAIMWTATVTAAATPLLLRRFLWRKSLKVIGVLYCGVGVVIQLVVLLLCIVLSILSPALGIASFVIGVPLSPMVLPVLVIGAFRRDSWWEDPLCCRVCGYDRSGLNPTALCPECGEAPRAIIGS